MQTKIVKWGNSLGLRIPRPFAREIRVEEGSVVELTTENGQLVIRVATPPEFALDDLLARINHQNLHREVDTGGPVGDETW